MASLKDIRTRISSVKNTRQITRAMKMVAAAKLRRSQEAIMASRPYAYRIYGIMLSLAGRTEVKHPLLLERPEKRVKLVALAGDRGLCGAFNASVFKEATRFIKAKQAEGIEVSLDVIGRKANDFFKKRHKIDQYHEGLIAKASYDRVSAVAKTILKEYEDEKFDAVYLVYNEFKSAIQQKCVTERLIPISTEVPDGVVGVEEIAEADKYKNFIFEPSREAIVDEIVPRHFTMQMFRAVLESVASEHGSRMSAMENASKKRRRK